MLSDDELPGESGRGHAGGNVVTVDSDSLHAVAVASGGQGAFVLVGYWGLGVTNLLWWVEIAYLLFLAMNKVWHPSVCPKLTPA